MSYLGPTVKPVAILDIATSTSPSAATLQDVNNIYACDVSGGPISFNIPSGCSVLTMFTLKDAFNGGDQASTNNITVNAPGGETIDGASSFLLAQDFVSVTFMKRTATDWMVM